MSIESKNHRSSDAVQVLVSEGSRRDAQPAKGMRFESHQEEYDHYCNQKRLIEAELAGYSKAAMAGEQVKIRRMYKGDPNKSYSEWMSKKSSMENARQKLISRKAKIEIEIHRLKPLVKDENRRMNPSLLKDGSVNLEMLHELRAIRELLEAILNSQK